MHTVTIHTTTHSLHLNTQFDTGEAAHEYARTLKTLNPDIRDTRITVTSTGCGTVELKANGWSRVNA